MKALYSTNETPLLWNCEQSLPRGFHFIPSGYSSTYSQQKIIVR
jgi:hypothetical protein